MPTSPLGFLVFVFIVAPGLFAELSLQRTKTRPKESAFIEVGRVLLASTVIAIPALGLGFLVWPLGDSGQWPNVTQLLKGDVGYVGNNFGALMLSALVYGVFSLCVAAPLFAKTVEKFDRRFMGRITDRYSAWSFTFDHPEQKGKALAEIRMQSGAIWLGAVKTYTPNHEMADRELILSGPVLHRPPDSANWTPTEHEAVVLKASEIESIAVQFYDPDAPNEAGGNQPAGDVNTVVSRAEPASAAR